MRIIISLYYLLFILSGGVRHLGIDFLFWNNVQGNQIAEVPLVISLIEIGLILYGFIIVLFYNSKYNHLVFGSLLFVIDLFFQNKVSYISSFILPHVFPFFFFFLLKYKDSLESRKLIGYIGMLFISVGYLTSFEAKFSSGWWDWNYLVLHSYIYNFSHYYEIPTLLGNSFLLIKSHLFWKSMDWLVLLFQFSFVVIFFRKHFFNYLSIFSIVFHIGILILMGIGVFYLYTLFYAFIYYCMIEGEYSYRWDKVWDGKIITIIAFIILGPLFILFSYSGFDAFFFNRFLSLQWYKFIEYAYNFICIFVMLLMIILYRKSVRQQKSNEKIPHI